ncbi:MAG: hypothetical protein ACLFQX_09620 [Candidatus Kapaibacterium sp.]
MKYLFVMAIIILTYGEMRAQCDCMQASAASASAMIGGTPDAGVLGRGKLRLAGYYRFIDGAAKYRETEIAEPYEMSYYAKFVGFSAAYGISGKLTIEGEAGWFTERGDYGLGAYSGEGFSHVGVSGKYNILSSREYGIEWTAGLGAKLPIGQSGVENEYTFGYDLGVFSSYYGGILHSFLHRKFDGGVHLFLISRADFNFESTDSGLVNPINVYRNSLFATKEFWRDMFAAAELRWVESRGRYIYISPQLGVRRHEFSISASFDIPLYEHSEFESMDIRTSFAINLVWQPSLAE